MFLKEIKSDKEEVLEEGIADIIMQYPKASFMLYLFVVNQAFKAYDRLPEETRNEISRRIENFSNTITGRVRIDSDDKDIKIKGIDYNKLRIRINEYYKDKKLTGLLVKNKTFIDGILFNLKIIREKEALEAYIDCPNFFALELYKLFNDLGDHYNLSYYNMIAAHIYKKTWLSKTIDDKEFPIDLSPLNNISYELKDYQKDFVKNFNTLKYKTNLNGYILSFDQGLGKTLTAVGLAECLNKKNIYILVPNSLKENWANEIKQYYKKYTNDEQLFKDEVFIVNHPKYNYTNKTKYVICNVESMDKIFEYLKFNDSMLIVDEFHVNFRNLKGTRSEQLFKIKDKLDTTDILLMSGTPIKAIPSEIAPALRLIDPLFDDRAAAIYIKAFSMDNIYAANIITERFQRFIYRKTKQDVLNLPRKHELTLNFLIKNYEKYLLSNVELYTSSRYDAIYEEKASRLEDTRNKYIEMVEKYSSSSDWDKDKYLKWIKKDVGVKGKQYDKHELTLEFLENYHNKYIIPNIIDTKEKQNFYSYYAEFLKIKQSAMGTAIGEVLPPLRSEMYIALYEENKDTIIKMIKENSKKTVIFSMMLDVVEYIYKDLQKQGIGIVKIVGGNGSTRMDEVKKFKNQDEIDVLIATSQTLSTGVTLTEATQMFFFGAPWRSADYQQASDRIHRIGQTQEVYIYNVLLSTQEDNLSTRMQDILNWSQKMFNRMIEKNNMIGGINPNNVDRITNSGYNKQNISNLYNESYNKDYLYECYKEIFPNEEYKAGIFL